MMSKWYDIQLNDSQSGVNSKDKQTTSESESGISGRTERTADQPNGYNVRNGRHNELTSSPIRCDYECNNVKRLQSRDSLLSSPSLSPNQSSTETQFDFDSSEIRGLRDRRISLLVDELLNDIYCNLRSERNRNLSCSSDTSNYSTPDLQKRPALKDYHLNGKGMPLLAIVCRRLKQCSSLSNITFVRLSFANCSQNSIIAKKISKSC